MKKLKKLPTFRDVLHHSADAGVAEVLPAAAGAAEVLPAGAAEAAEVLPPAAAGAAQDEIRFSCSFIRFKIKSSIKF